MKLWMARIMLSLDNDSYQKNMIDFNLRKFIFLVIGSRTYTQYDHIDRFPQSSSLT